MITDKLKNINIYTQIPSEARNFINSLQCNSESGRIILSDDIYVNIETYNTKFLSDAKFEAHEKYIDIQILLSGSESIFYTDKSGLNPYEPYDAVKDIIFYKEKVNGYPKVTLTGDNFVMLFPHEAHAPQVCTDEKSETVKKVVMKIRA